MDEVAYRHGMADILLKSYHPRKKLLLELRRAEEARMWLHVDPLTEIERVKRLFGLPYDSLFAVRKTPDEGFKDWVEAPSPVSPTRSTFVHSVTYEKQASRRAEQRATGHAGKERRLSLPLLSPQ